MARACAGVEVVFHEAAIPSVPRSLADPISSNDVNIDRHAERPARGEARRRPAPGLRGVVVGVRRHADAAQDRDDAPAPLSPYAVGKLAGEHYCQVFAGAYGLETVCLRYFNVFGARQDPKSEYAAVIPRFVTAALAGQGVTIFGDGKQSRDFCYIDNTVEANLAAASAPAADASGRVFNVACGVATTLNDVVRLISEALGRPIPITYADRRIGDVKHSLADIAAAKSQLGYRGAVSFAEGLGRTIAWYGERRPR